MPGDIPAKLVKYFAAYLAEPLTDIFNTSLLRGEYPQIFKYEVCTPVPKCFPPKKVEKMRNISGLLNFDGIFEKMLSELIISDMQKTMDPTQFGNRNEISIQHYLVKLINRILTAVDRTSQKESFAVVASMIDWKDAFPRQCPELGVLSFQKNGVRASLLPLLVNFFQDRKMSVKWHGCRSTTRSINGGGPQGATMGVLEYLAQSNNNADWVSEEDRFKFFDDLTILEVVNLLTIGISSFNFKFQVASDIPCHGQYIPPENLQTQDNLNKIQEWTKKQKMMINKQK